MAPHPKVYNLIKLSEVLKRMRKYKYNNTTKYILYYIVAITILLSFTTINNSYINDNDVSALDYSSNVGIGFTFNPTLSVSLSSSDLVIPNLIPGNTLDSNSINVSVATNTAYGYTLSANVNDENLVHSNNINTFSSIATNADLASLDTDNTWGYTSKLSNEIAWNNYNGLSSSSNAILLDNNNTADSTGGIDFKIAAKAGSTQPSGEYTGTINFIAVTKVAPMSLLDSFIASGAEQLNGYFKMQDMTHDICSNVDIEESKLQLIDVRDNKIYWVAKLKDGNCWMTQNLDLDIIAGSTNLTSNNTDLSTDESVYTDNNTIYALKSAEDTYGYIYKNGTTTWIPERTTISYNQLNRTTWQDSNTDPYSWDRLGTSEATMGQPVHPDDNVSNEHGLAGNYYNWTASLASNDSTNATGNPANSICPKGWRLPNITNKEFGNLLVSYGIIETNTSTSYITNVNSATLMPLYFIRNGEVHGGGIIVSGSYGGYWSSTSSGTSHAYNLYFGPDNIRPQGSYGKFIGWAVRCIAK